MGDNVIDVTPPQPQTPPQEAILVQETEVDIVAVPVPVPVMITPDVGTMAIPDVSSDRVRGRYLALFAHQRDCIASFMSACRHCTSLSWYQFHCQYDCDSLCQANAMNTPRVVSARVCGASGP